MERVPHHFSAADLAGGHLALDLANTVTARDTIPRDWLVDFHVACDWAQLTKAFPVSELARLRSLAAAHSRSAREALTRLCELRECVHDGVACQIASARIPVAVVRLLEKHWKDAAAAASFDQAGVLAPRWTTGASGLDLIRHTVAWQAIALLGSEVLARTRVCAGSDCGWLFVDTSKSGRRIWCDMKTCGNVAKARRHYRRRLVVSKAP